MKKKKNRLDEMQEQKMLQIEHNGCWIAFWGLVVVMFGQLILYGEDRSELFAGEWIVFMCLAVYIGGACIKNGLWDRRWKPSAKVNLCASAVAGLAGGMIRFFAAYYRYGNVRGALAIGCVIFGNIFVMCFLAMSLALWIYRKRNEHLEEEDEQELPDEQEK